MVSGMQEVCACCQTKDELHVKHVAVGCYNGFVGFNLGLHCRPWYKTAKAVPSMWHNNPREG